MKGSPHINQIMLLNNTSKISFRFCSPPPVTFNFIAILPFLDMALNAVFLPSSPFYLHNNPESRLV